MKTVKIEKRDYPGVHVLSAMEMNKVLFASGQHTDVVPPGPGKPHSPADAGSLPVVAR